MTSPEKMYAEVSKTFVLTPESTSVFGWKAYKNSVFILFKSKPIIYEYQLEQRYLHQFKTRVKRSAGQAAAQLKALSSNYIKYDDLELLARAYPELLKQIKKRTPPTQITTCANVYPLESWL